MRPANLLPADLSSSRRALPGAALGALGAGTAVGVLLAGGFFVQQGKIAEREEQLADLQMQLAAVPVRKRPAIQVPRELEAEKDQRQAAVGQALAKRVAWDRVLRELSLVLPEDVWLKTLSAKSPHAGDSEDTRAAPTTTTAPTGFVLNGYTYSQAGVARLLTRLSLVPNLTNVQLQTSSSTEIGNRRIIGFTIAADVRDSEVTR